MTVPLIILIVVIVAIVGFVILLYNSLVQRRLRVDEAFAQIEVQLKRRHDLIPNLVEAVKGYMQFEQKVLTDVTNARASAIAAGAQGPAAQAQAENVLTGALRSLFAVVENYPQLKANENVLVAPGAADHDGEPDRVRPPALQRHRPRLQHRHPDVPGGPHRRHARLRQARVLRGGGRGADGPDGRPRLRRRPHPPPRPRRRAPPVDPGTSGRSERRPTGRLIAARSRPSNRRDPGTGRHHGGHVLQPDLRQQAEFGPARGRSRRSSSRCWG